MDDLRDVFGIGVAGNFTGHLEQAGEASDFADLADLATADPTAPKGVFPFYVPGEGEHFLHRYPLSASKVRLPQDGSSVQLEPELGLLCDMHYADGQVERIVPREFGAYNDCSIRRGGVGKISQKKNWGANSKGFSDTRIAVDGFGPGGTLDHVRIACLLVRHGQVHSYGIDSAVRSYSYFYGRLLDWLVDTLNNQRDDGPLEDMGRWLEVAGRPSRALISVGATRYTPFGESNYLQPGDEAFVLAYDGRLHGIDTLATSLPGAIPPAAGLSILHQRS